MEVSFLGHCTGFRIGFDWMIQIEVGVLICKWGGTNRRASHVTVWLLRVLIPRREVMTSGCCIHIILVFAQWQTYRANLAVHFVTILQTWELVEGSGSYIGSVICCHCVSLTLAYLYAGNARKLLQTCILFIFFVTCAGTHSWTAGWKIPFFCIK